MGKSYYDIEIKSRPLITLDQGGSEFAEFSEATYKIWNSISRFLSKKIYTYQEESFTVFFDWKSALETDRGEEELRFILSEKTPVPYEELQKIIHKKIDVPCRVEYIGKRDIAKHVYIYFAEQFIYEIFLIANIACPGSCDISFEIENGIVATPTKISLSGGIFADSWRFSKKNNWPKFHVLELEEILEWYNKLDVGTKQVATNRIEKALFSMLQLCTAKSVSHEELLWLAYGLESVFNTRIGKTFEDILYRSIAMLEIEQKYFQDVKKNLRMFYDERSAFVHGGAKIFHPLHNDVLDKKVAKTSYELIAVTEFAATLLISSIQVLAQNKASEALFEYETKLSFKH